jgi:hypothetical protein
VATPAAAGADGSFCGPALSLTAARVDASAGAADAAVRVSQPIPPCAPAGAAGAAAQSLPPPSVAIPGAFLRRGLGAAGLGAALSADVAIVQLGTSFVDEAAGFAAMPFAAPNGAAAASAAALAAGIAALNATAAGDNATSAAGAAAAGSVQAAIAAIGSLSRASSPVVAALDAARPLDTRLLTVTLHSRAGALLPVANAPAPFVATIPLKDAAGAGGGASAGLAAGE